MKNIALSYQQKFYLLLCLSACMVLLTYQLALKKTIYYIALSASQQQTLPDDRVSDTDWARVNAKEEAMAGVLKSSAAVDINQTNNLLEVLGKGCSAYKLKLEEVSSPVLYRDSGFTVMTSRIRLEGSFRNLLMLIDTLEKDKKLGKISAVDFRSLQNSNSTSRKLECVFYLQNLADFR